MATSEIDFDPVKPGTSEATLYTPTSGYGVVTQLIFANTSGSAATVTVGKNALTDPFVPAVSIPANTVETLDLAGMRIPNGETLRALQGTAGAIVVALCGYEVT